ncbi:MAG: signal peptide peptidase SppA [Planctomycetes bacterium]|nr:signal peptide peptidase SppA [Planctomycetota bacterium]
MRATGGRWAWAGGLGIAVAMAATVIRPSRAEEPPTAVADGAQVEPREGVRQSGRDAPAKKAAATIAHVRIAGSLPDGVGQGGLLADVAPHLHRLVERLDKAAADSRVKGVVVSIDSPDLGRGRAEEVRAAIERITKAGKPVAAHLVSGAATHYAVASACDTITMPPAATLELTGVRTEMMFFKSMLDRLGVAAEILQVGEFKGAGEPLTRDSMSPALRAQYESFVGDLYEQLVERVAADRGLTAERVRELIDTGVFTPEAAREAKLIDAVGYEDEVIATLAKQVGDESPKLARDYAQRKFDQDFSGMAGLVKLMELLSGQKQAAPLGKNKRIAVVHVTGEIREGKSADDVLMGGAAGSETIMKAIRDAAKDEQVAAIVLRIDSPGGSALASDLIWREADRAKKPVVASFSDIAASGGYYIAAAADTIVAAPGTLTGSIGVVGGKVAVGDALGKVGVHTDVVSKGKNAGWLSMHEPFTPGEREAFMGTMKEVYRLFTSKVAAGRKLDPAVVEKLAEGRVFTGRQAKENGLVDRLGTLDDAIDEAKKLAGIDADDEVDRLLLPEPRGLFDELLGSAAAGGDPVARMAAVAGGRTALHGLLLARITGLPGLEWLAVEADALSLVLSGRPQLLMPVRIRVR